MTDPLAVLQRIRQSRPRDLPGTALADPLQHGERVRHPPDTSISTGQLS